MQFNKEIRMEKMNVKPATGKLGVLCVGLGAVTSTFMTGVLMARKGLAKPVGSMTQYDKMRVGRGENKKYLHYGEIVPLASLNDIVFGAWDVYPANAYESAVNAEVLQEKDINPVKDELEKIVPMKAAFDHNYASRLDGNNVKDCKNRWDMVEQLREDIRNFKAANNCERIVVLWAASTEIYVPVDEKIHGTLAALEEAMKADDKEHIAPSMCYAYAALSEGAPFIMGAPNTTVDIPAMWELAEKTKMPIAGKDFKTGQTLVKSGFAPIIGTAGSLLIYWVTVTVWFWMNRLISVQKKSASCLHWNQFWYLKNSLICIQIIIIKYVSITILPATTVRKVGTILTFSDGWVILCRLRLTSFAVIQSLLHLCVWTWYC